MEMSGQDYDLVTLSPGKVPGTHCGRGYIDSEPAWRDAENLTLTGYLSRTTQFIMRRYTDCVILATTMDLNTRNYLPSVKVHGLS